jgi:hypothetical protein
MKRPVLVVALALVLIAAIGSIIYFKNQRTRLSGDAWNYTLVQKDLPQGWQVGQSQLQTAYDIQRASQTPPAGLQSVYSIEFTHPTKLDVFDITSQVLVYDSPDAAQTAFAAEAPGAEWEAVPDGRSLGDATAVWRLKPRTDAPDQASYRVDFRRLNGVASVGVVGLVGQMKDASTAYIYAAKILDKMQGDPTPAALQTLGDRPDLRGLLLAQNDLARLDSHQGDQWEYNSLLIPGWTPNSAFDNPAGMENLGRLMGYQAWLIKPLGDKELGPETTVALFQQVTVFRSPEQAQTTLDKMAGLNSGAWTKPPAVGDSAKGWTQVFDAQNSSAGTGAVPTTEISFRVGAYTGSIRVQTAPVQAANLLVARAADEKLANDLANALAARLQNAGK